jgi:hypothetical protein
VLNEKQFQRVVKNITDALNKNDVRLLTIPTCKWILENYWLRPQDYWDLMYDWQRYSRKDFEKFFTTFDLFSHFIDEVDLNYGLSWIIHWIERKQGKYEDVKSSLERFKQRCILVHTVRRNIGLKTYSIHYTYNNGWNGKNKRYVIQQRGRSMNEALHLFLERWKSRDKFSFFKIHKIKKVSDTALYYIQQDARLPLEVYEFLTTGTAAVYTGKSFEW